jgi:hypothetical protein
MVVVKAKTKKKKKVGRPVGRPRKVRTPKADKMELFLKAVAERFPNDSTAPGLVIAWIPGKEHGFFYVSIRRYEGLSNRVHMFETAQSLLVAMNAVRNRFKQELSQTSATEEFLRS